jgi:PIN domain nuclease of toxin-antitoxin system
MAAEPEGLLVDTHLLLWWASMPEQLPAAARSRLESFDQPLVFSVVSLWEVAIKASLGRGDFQVSPLALRMGLLQEGFRELPIQVEHVLAVQHLPWIHRDPFDRLLVAQAAQERLSLLTADRNLLGYGEAVSWAGA